MTLRFSSGPLPTPIPNQVLRRRLIFASGLLPMVPLSAWADGPIILPSTGDGDATPLLKAALLQSSKTGQPVRLSGWHHIKGVIQAPPGAGIIGSGLDSSGLIHDASGDAIVITGPGTFDGFTVDGGRRSDADRKAWVKGTLFGVYGPTGRYLEGVKLSRIGIRNTVTQGIALQNVTGLRIQELRVHSCWGGHALTVAGAKDCLFTSIVVDDVGQIGPEGDRGGSGLALFSERDPKKRRAAPYIPTSDLPSSNLHFGRVSATHCTDTSVYLHDYPGGGGLQGVSFDEVAIDGSGHDGFKIREFVRDVKAHTVSATNVALRGISIEDTERVHIVEATVTHAGHGAMSAMLRRPASFNGSTDGRDISTTPAGISIFSSEDVAIDAIRIQDVDANPVNGAYGYGLWLKDSSHLKLSGTINETDRAALRISNIKDSDISLAVAGAARKMSGSAAELANDGGGNSSGVRLTLKDLRGGPAPKAKLMDRASKVEVNGAPAS